MSEHPGPPDLHERLERVERALQAGVRHAEQALPAWRRATAGEPRWPMALAVAGAIALQLAVPARLSLPPHWLLPALGGVLLVGLLVTNPGRIHRHNRLMRGTGLLLIAVVSVANIVSVARLVVGLVYGREGTDAAGLLTTGAAVYLTNVIVFALWYWELDRGGPAARAQGEGPYPAFMFPQMANPQLAPPDWEPAFPDYLYLSFTNATAFSPTDVMPLARWAKLAMLLQSAVALVTVVLVVARAVNILR